MDLDAFELIANKFASEHLERVTHEVRTKARTYARKEVNDALWGTIGITGPEVALLDSALLQRLRFVRQLGVVHWIYPGAGHTRFEHTLGVLRQVQYLCTAINTVGEQGGLGQLIAPAQVQLLRFAAILHDVGHPAFSHVTELSLEAQTSMASLPAAFAKRHKSEPRHLSEIFAYYIVRSPAMTGFIEALTDQHTNFIQLDHNRRANVREIIDKLSAAIIGQSIDTRLPLLHEIISGPFDADKLDYFVRDAKCAGTPSLIDISRLIQKISVREVGAEDLPAEVAARVNRRAEYVLFGIKWSGISILDELHLSRVLLYAKIYRHPKVVAIEQMIRSGLTLIARCVTPSKLIEFVYAHNDDELIGVGTERMAALLGLGPVADLPAEKAECLEEAAIIFANIKFRRLAEKSFQLHRNYPADPRAALDRQKRGLIELREAFEHPDDREFLRGELIVEVERVMRALGEVPPRRTHLDGAVMMHPIGKTPGGTQIGRAYLLPRSGRPAEFRDYMVNRTAWADGYLSDQPAAYVFADHDLADRVYVAMERLARVHYGVVLPDSALEASKRDAEDVSRLKRRLRDAGYYASAPYDLRPMPNRLEKADVTPIVERFSIVLNKYQTPDTHVGEKTLPSRQRCLDWLQQFDDDAHAECALRLLSHFRMIDRTDTVASLKTFIDGNPQFRDGVVVPFGSARDSTAIQTYFSADLQGTHIHRCMTLEEALRGAGNRPLIFVDDFVGSGGQGKDILAAGFGRDDLRADLDEQRDLFGSDIQDFLRNARCAFVFTAAWDEGVRLIRDTANDLALDAVVYRHIGEADIPFADEMCFTGIDREQADAFMAVCSHVGASLVRSTAKRRPTESEADFASKVASRALGYGNKAMLLASPFNVPTQTMTPFWGQGRVDGVEWTPLLPRRKKA